MLSQIFKKSQQSKENKKAFETLQRSVSNGFEDVEPNEENQEEDGFLVVGETEKERNTIKPLPAPPSYDMHQEYPLCSQPSATATSIPYGSHLDAFQPIHTPAQYTNDHSSKLSPLNGVPFKLSATASLVLGGLLGDMSVPRIKTFQPDKFEYDFSHEHSVVKEDFTT